MVVPLFVGLHACLRVRLFVCLVDCMLVFVCVRVCVLLFVCDLLFV